MTHMQDFVELLNAEQHVQVDKLREHARHGISARVRGEVWMYLLSVLSSDRTAEITFLLSLNSSYSTLPSGLPSKVVSNIHQTALRHHTHRFHNPTYAGLISSLTAEADPPLTLSSSTGPSQYHHHHHHHASSTSGSGTAAGGTGGKGQAEQTLRSQYGRFLPPPPTSPPSRHAYITTLEEVLGKYWNEEKEAGRHVAEGEERNWVYLATPFACCYARPVAVFLAYQKMMERIRSFPPLPSRLASLLTLFRLSQPELFSYFEDEQVRYVEVATSWLTTMLAKEMWLGDVLRLWDSYLASDDMFSLHCYVCVAILGTCKETLEELDGSEAKLMLMDLPPMDVDRLLQDAANLRVSFPLPVPVDD